LCSGERSGRFGNVARVEYISPGQVGARLRADAADRGRNVQAAIREAAALGAEVIAREAPRDLGILAASIKVQGRETPEIRATAPHASIVELGSRPHTPPIGPLLEWARRHGLDEGIAYAIQQTIARVGTRPRHFIHGNLDKLRAILNEVMRRRNA